MWKLKINQGEKKNYGKETKNIIISKYRNIICEENSHTLKSEYYDNIYRYAKNITNPNKTTDCRAD